MPIPLPLRPLVLAGLAGELAFELYAWLISPVLFGVRLEPANLVVGLIQKYLGPALPYSAGFALHFALGALVFPLVVWLVHRITRTGWLVSGAITGLALWFIAQGILAPLMGRAFMMGFGSYTQSSLIAHVGMTLVIAVVFRLQKVNGVLDAARS
ncbi:MAG: hypothetical protein NXH97_12200 [Rhodobacteraceae bacterium]|nr:hypothetical protein [Paracoccaceae bacterium]